VPPVWLLLPVSVVVRPPWPTTRATFAPAGLSTTEELSVKAPEMLLMKSSLVPLVAAAPPAVPRPRVAVLPIEEAADGVASDVRRG
jgi:hypothetical protein